MYSITCHVFGTFEVTCSVHLRTDVHTYKSGGILLMSVFAN